MNESYRFDVETVRRGQTRPYGPTINEFVLTDNSPSPHPEQVVRAFCEAVISPPFRPGAGLDSTEELEQIEGGRWRYRQTVPFMD